VQREKTSGGGGKGRTGTVQRTRSKKDNSLLAWRKNDQMERTTGAQDWERTDSVERENTRLFEKKKREQRGILSRIDGAERVIKY